MLVMSHCFFLHDVRDDCDNDREAWDTAVMLWPLSKISWRFELWYWASGLTFAILALCSPMQHGLIIVWPTNLCQIYSMCQMSSKHLCHLNIACVMLLVCYSRCKTSLLCHIYLNTFVCTVSQCINLPTSPRHREEVYPMVLYDQKQ